MECVPAREDVIASVWEPWGLPIVSVRREYYPPDVSGLVLPAQDGKPEGLVTWSKDGTNAEIVTLDAFPPGKGSGTRLLCEAEATLRTEGVGRVWLLTTNDNIRALGFYLRNGYRLVRVHLDAMERVWKFKPDKSRIGNNNVPLRDLWEVEKILS